MLISLAECKFVKDRENLICVGQSGTGKTYISTAIGIPAIQQGYRVRYIKVSDLVQELLKAESQYPLLRYPRRIGYINLGSGSPLLFQFLLGSL